MARSRGTWNPEQARIAWEKSRQARKNRPAPTRSPDPLLAPDESAPPFPLALKARVRAQVLSLLDGLDLQLCKARLDGATIDRLASALERLAELERVLDGRPGPGNRRPPREDLPSAKAAPAPRPAFTHAGPAPAAVDPPTITRTIPSATPSPEPPAQEPPTLSERPDF